MTEYRATDDDLPEIFFKPDHERIPENCARYDRATAVQLHYPEIKISASQRRRRDAADRSEREVQLGADRKIYVKLSKKCQMWDWLRGLFLAETIGQVRAENSDAVMRFLTQMYAKFYRYTPYKVKWITMKQYAWLKHIALQYLKVPNEKR